MDNNSDHYRILIVDDSQDIHTIFNKIISYRPQINPALKPNLKNFPTFKVDSAFQGEEAAKMVEKAMLENKPYALAFIDIRMPPGWDGMKTIQRIWEIDKDVQIVICTAVDDYSWEETINQLGAIDSFLILKKPFDAITVRQLTCALTSKWKLMRDARQYTESLEKQIEDRTTQLRFQATHDVLTNLPNRALLNQRLNELISQSNPETDVFALFFFDLDRFKMINDTLTHQVGDQVLQAVARRFTEIVDPEKNIIARLGGDEFVVLLTESRLTRKVNETAQSLQAALNMPFNIGYHELMITSSVGVSLFPKDGGDAETLCRNADTAMYKAKERGPNNFQIYEANFNQYGLERLELENQLFRAIKKSEFILYYQPEFNLETNKLEGIESLIRWQHPDRGLIMPMEFIPVAEETGQILQIGEWVLRKACKQNKIWQNEGFAKIRIGVNIAVNQFERRQELEDLVKNVLDETKLAPQYLEIELSENIIIESAEIIKTVHSLKDLGVQIALDDFGTGYSNLGYLKKLPLNRIKIDRIFIQNIGINADDEAIIRAIIAVANSLNIQVIAEGVESRTQLDFLRKEGCYSVQGFYFSKALPVREIEDLFASLQKTQK